MYVYIFNEFYIRTLNIMWNTFDWDDVKLDYSLFRGKMEKFFFKPQQEYRSVPNVLYIYIYIYILYTKHERFPAVKCIYVITAVAIFN